MLRFIAVKDRSQPVATGCYVPVFFRTFISESERPRPVVRSFSGPVRSSLWSFCGPRTGPANTNQQGEELTKKPVKKESMLDLLTIMSDRVMVKFKVRADTYETETERWCNVCK